MSEAKIKNKGKQTQSAHLEENTGKNRLAAGVLSETKLKVCALTVNIGMRLKETPYAEESYHALWISRRAEIW